MHGVCQRTRAIDNLFGAIATPSNRADDVHTSHSATKAQSLAPSAAANDEPTAGPENQRQTEVGCSSFTCRAEATITMAQMAIKPHLSHAPTPYHSAVAAFSLAARVSRLRCRRAASIPSVPPRRRPSRCDCQHRISRRGRGSRRHCTHCPIFFWGGHPVQRREWTFLSP